jgi:hypothetical protein
MKKVTLFIPSEEAVDRSFGARQYARRLAKRVELDRRYYKDAIRNPEIAADADAAGLFAGLASLDVDSGYMETDLDEIFRPQELITKLRAKLGPSFPIVAVVDDTHSDYIMSVYLKAGATAVCGVQGDLFGIVLSRMGDWSDIYPFLNVFARIQ